MPSAELADDNPDDVYSDEEGYEEEEAKAAAAATTMTRTMICLRRSRVGDRTSSRPASRFQPR
jgi:hypothetical protein